MKRVLIALCLLFSFFGARAQEQEYIQVDWYPLLTDSVGFNITSGGIAFGFVDGISSEADVKMGRSFQISWLNVIGAKFNTGHGQRISVGVGLDWKNYKLASSQRFVVGDGGVSVQPYPAGAKPCKSRLKVFALELPVIIRQRIGSRVDLFAGEITNFNVHSSIVSKWESAEGTVEEATTKGIHTAPVTFDLIAGVAYRKVGAYLRYSPCRVIKEGYGPKINTLSVGLVLGL
ncbi:MAG: hypothetical protein Q4B68_03520 [Bacteroidales bacterium]|nr:hypothetical protein [Bacteroidales bacterium]